ncbi:MAG: TetR/AcrR family transcriptional regulator [Pseudomonadota bacterium]
MSQDATSGADPKRSIDLLWGSTEPGRRGPKPRYSVEEVVAAAIAVADAEGLGAISVRRIAVELGVSPMSIYTYVPSKAELVLLMYDRVLGETRDPEAVCDGWRERLMFIAAERWTLCERHPWMLDLAMHRPPLGPNLLERHEAALRILAGTGLDEITKDLVIDVLHHYLLGALKQAREAREVERESGLTDEQWFAEAEPAIMARLEPGKFPNLMRLGEAWREIDKAQFADPQWRFRFGLQVVLDGIEALIAARPARPS